MKEPSPSSQDKSHGGSHPSPRRSDPRPPPLGRSQTWSFNLPKSTANSSNNGGFISHTGADDTTEGQHATAAVTDDDGNSGKARDAPPPQATESGAVVGAVSDEKDHKPNRTMLQSFWHNTKSVLVHTKLNVLLVFVPVGIAVSQVHGTSPGLVFAMNAIAIVPLAGLLSFSTESVAHRLGDSLGALLNVTFGNAVELIIFMYVIALVKNEIRIVQASLLGSILANLLLILGMSFFLGGLRFREQIYNSTVTQMSACLLSLSVISLVLPTAFHASFRDAKTADAQSLKISRGTSVILLLVYIVYLLFQLISHSYLYESTPQHIIDEEATPGPAANWLDSSSSDSTSSSDSDSNHSGHSRGTMTQRMKRVMHRRRRSSPASADASETCPRPNSNSTNDEQPSEQLSSPPHLTNRTSSSAVLDEEEEDGEHENAARHRKHRHRRPSFKKHRKHKHKARRRGPHELAGEDVIDENAVIGTNPDAAHDEPRGLDFAAGSASLNPENPGEMRRTRSPLQGLRTMSLRPVAMNFAPTVFTQRPDAEIPPVPAGPVPRVRFGTRSTNALPDRLRPAYRPHGAIMPSQIPLAHMPTAAMAKEDHAEDLSRTAAVILLLFSTALVAVCAEFMVDSINGLVATGGVGEVFIGLIILPIVGNAAEHVTAITVAMKNKMDLAIGVAVGSSIQIALFITPLVVIIGWAMNRDMTLYFTLFETVCLFVSAFITNFLVLDGRSNYLEGALLMATYVIIGVVAFFYPDANDASSWGA
ncbi:hypothetical protein VTK26DRAFT_6399 [Humicola hyalothermophila]